MSVFGSVVDEVIATLKGSAEAGDIAFVQEYPGGAKPKPVKKLCAAVGLESAEVKGGALGGYFGQQNAKDLHGKQAAICMRILVYAPLAVGGGACTEAASRICGALVFSSGLGVYAVNVGKVYYDSSASAFTAECSAKLRVYLGQESDDTAVGKLIVKGVLN